MNLGMAVMAASNYIGSLGSLYLLVLDFSVKKSFFFKTGLEISAATAAAEVIALVWIGIHKILFAHACLNDITDVISCCVAKGFADNIAWVLNGEFNLEILVPIGTRLESAFADPLCVVLIDGADFEVVRDVVLFQTCQD